jgi:hypothetical protein
VNDGTELSRGDRNRNDGSRGWVMWRAPLRPGVGGVTPVRWSLYSNCLCDQWSRRYLFKPGG